MAAIARRPSVKPTTNGTGFVLLVGATGFDSVGNTVKVVDVSDSRCDSVGNAVEVVGVSDSRRTLFDEKKRERVSH